MNLARRQFGDVLRRQWISLQSGIEVDDGGGCEAEFRFSDFDVDQIVNSGAGLGRGRLMTGSIYCRAVRCVQVVEILHLPSSAFQQQNVSPSKEENLPRRDLQADTASYSYQKANCTALSSSSP